MKDPTMTQPSPASPLLKLTLPKGRIQEKLLVLLGDMGLTLSTSSRSYRPVCNDPRLDVKVLKPQNIASLVGLGRHDCGFTGADWVAEQQADVVELLDLGLDPVSIVAALPEALLAEVGNPLEGAQLPHGRPWLVASEYPVLTQTWLAKHAINATYVRSYGATEALPPDDADMIVDNTATGSTLRQNRLAIVATVMTSTTRLIANKQVMDDPAKRVVLEEMVMLMEACLRARNKVLVEMNVEAERVEALLASVPAMRSPTVSPLHGANPAGQNGFAIKIAVDRLALPALLPTLKAAGAQDILVYKLEKILP